MSNKKWPWLILVVILSFFSFKSLLKSGYFPMHDDMQAMRVLQMDKCVKDRQIPCRWVPDMGYGYGYPQFIYYPPLPFYAMEAFHLAGLSILDSVKAGFILSFLIAGMAMFVLGKALWGDAGGLVSAVFFVYAPYRAVNVYSRGAVGEIWALGFLPVVLWAILELVRKQRSKYLIMLSISYGGLLLTHNITALIFTPIAILWGIFLVWYFKRWKIVAKLAIGALGGVCLAGFYILPVIFEKKYAHVETMTWGYFNYLAHFVSLKQLFASTYWGYGSSILGPYDELSFAIGFLHWIFAILTVGVYFWLRKANRFLFYCSLFFGGVFLGAAFMTHQRSVYIWNALSILSYLQFPWRFLTLVMLATSVLGGGLLSLIGKTQTKTIFAGVMSLLVIFFNAFYFFPQDWYNITDKEKFSGELWQKQLTISIFDYLPVFSKAPPAKKAPDKPFFVVGEGVILEFEKGSNWQRGVALVESDKALLRLPLYYFPGFKVLVDAQEISIRYDNDLGLITFTIKRGKHRFSARLRNTFVRAAGDALSVMSVLAIVLWLATNRFYEKK